MRNLARDFFSAADQDRIQEVVKDAENRTSGEIVCLVVSASYDYPMADVIGATALALPPALAITPWLGGLLWLGTQSMWLFIGLFALFFILAYFIVAFSSALKRLFISRRDLEEEVEEAAVTHFFRHGLNRTSEGTGILIFISVFERRVRVLADHGISARIPEAEWDAVVGRITEGMRRNRAAEAVCAAVREIGARLATHFPAKHDNRNELDDMIVSDD